MGETTSDLGVWIGDFIVANGSAVGPVLLLTVCAVALGLVRGLRERMSSSLSAAARAVLLVGGVAVLAAQVADHGWLVDVDIAVTTWFVAHRAPTADVVELGITNALGPAVIAASAVLVAGVALVRFRSSLCALTVLVTVGSAGTLCTVLKLLTARHRPPLGIQETLETDYSFPSGHVTGVTALVGMLVVVVSIGRSSAVRNWSSGCALVLVVAVATSRVYLGVHWLTDVLAGVLLGSAAAVIGATVLRGLVRRRETQCSAARNAASARSTASVAAGTTPA